jgi:uncharacterized protein with PQ loop repeat
MKCNFKIILVFIFGQIMLWPQLYLILKNKSAWDVSVNGFLGAFIFAFWCLVYSILKKDIQFILISGFLALSSFLVVISIFIFE